MLNSFTRDPAVKALILLPRATDRLHFSRGWHCPWTNAHPSLLDAIQLLTNHVPIRVVFRAPFLLLEADSDLPAALVQSEDYETAISLQSKPAAFSSVHLDANWPRLQTAAKAALSVRIEPALDTDAWAHFYRAYFAAWDLNGRELIEALCLATRTRASITRHKVTFVLDPRNGPLQFEQPAARAALLDGANLEALSLATGELIQGCRVPLGNGRVFYTPDGRGHYRALWTRDFAYMLENAGDWLVPSEVESCLDTLIKRIRADGAAPDRVEPDGKAIYVAGPPDKPLGEPNLDNPQFLVLAVDGYLRRLSKSHALALFMQWEARLHQSLDYLPCNEQGLIFNDPRKPHSPYGFTDTVRKTGALCMESLLLWQACHRLAAWDRAAGKAAEARALLRRAEQIAAHLSTLWDHEVGAFLAASQDGRQIDIWANAYVLNIGFPLGPKRAQVRRFLADHYGEYVWHGQVRHLLNGQYWQSLLTPVAAGQYQNGAYWATASGWVMTALAEAQPALARQMFQDLLADFQQNGVCECVNEGYRQLPSYVVSATNPLAAARRLRF